MVARPAVFIDRDGTLTEEVGYVNHPRRIRLLPRSAEAIRRLNAAGVPVVLATNQAGIARGYFSPQVLRLTNEEMTRQLKEAGARLDGVYVCVHHPTEGAAPYRLECDCRKPKPGMAVQAARELGLDLTRSYVIGDHWSDVGLANAVGARGILVRTGSGSSQEHLPREGAQPAAILDHLMAAATWILLDSRGRAA